MQRLQKIMLGYALQCSAYGILGFVRAALQRLQGGRLPAYGCVISLNGVAQVVEPMRLPFMQKNTRLAEVF